MVRPSGALAANRTAVTDEDERLSHTLTDDSESAPLSLVTIQSKHKRANTCLNVSVLYAQIQYQIKCHEVSSPNMYAYIYISVIRTDKTPRLGTHVKKKIYIYDFKLIQIF